MHCLRPNKSVSIGFTLCSLPFNWTFLLPTETWTWIGLQVSQINHLTCVKYYKCDISKFDQIKQRRSQSLEMRVTTIIKRKDKH